MLVSSGDVLYVGETCNLHQRFNNSRYGSYGFITPASCYVGGQSTNCKLNHLVLQQFEARLPVLLYFLQTREHKRVEKELLLHFCTLYNRRG